MKAQLVCDALTMAIWQRKPDEGLIVYSDQEVQYASHQYRTLLKNNGFIESMSKKDYCWDNAVAESRDVPETINLKTIKANGLISNMTQ